MAVLIRLAGGDARATKASPTFLSKAPARRRCHRFK
jgi:hypothetical protein